MRKQLLRGPCAGSVMEVVMVKWRRPASSSFRPAPSARQATLNAGKERADQLLHRGQVEEALAILEPLTADFGQDAELLLLIGTCFFELGNPDAALSYFERAYALDKQPGILIPLGLACYELEMYGSALHAFYESLRRGVPLPDQFQPVLKQLRQDVDAMAQEMGLAREKAIAGLRDMERARRWLDHGEYARAIDANRAAIRQLGDWPVPHNNLALALFFDGQVAAAIAECRLVLARRPENITATCNLVRCLAWSGERAAAQTAWQPLRLHIPADLPLDALKLAEAAAVVDDDESVRRLLLPIGDWPPEAFANPRYYLQAQQFLATADANLGNPKAAKRRMRTLAADDDPRLQKLRIALQQGKTGLGLTPRFAYYYSHELVPGSVAQEFAALVEATDDGRNPQAAKALKRFVGRFPQLVVMAEKAIWEEDAIDFGLLTLRYVGTPAAHAALRRFAGSQAGSDEQRMHALLGLQASGGAHPGEAFRIWRNGAWTEIELRGFTIGPREEHPPRKPQVAKLIEQGRAAMRAGEWAEAAALMRQAIALEPRAYEAFNNLAAALDRSGDPETSRAVLEQALAINPNYVFARVNLAMKLLAEDIDAAAARLAPLEALTSFTAEEFVFYQYGLAQVAVARKDCETARRLLDMALSIDPDHDPSTKLLAQVDEIEFRMGSGEFWAKARKRWTDSNAQYRRRQQAKLATLTPPVAAAVGIYSAEALRPVARAIAPWQRLTGLRKADLIKLVIAALLEPATIAALVSERLRDSECAALAAVLDAGGAMPQPQFRQAYGDDADESPWWQYTLPESVAGRLRLHCLLVETTVDGVVYLAIPAELREPLAAALRARQGPNVTP